MARPYEGADTYALITSASRKEEEAVLTWAAVSHELLARKAFPDVDVFVRALPKIKNAMIAGFLPAERTLYISGVKSPQREVLKRRIDVSRALQSLCGT